MPKPDAGNARARMNRAQRRKAPKILAAKVGGKKKLAAMLEEAKARAREADADKERAGHGVENPNMLRERDVTLSIDGKEVSGPPAHFSSESDFDEDGGT